MKLPTDLVSVIIPAKYVISDQSFHRIVISHVSNSSRIFAARKQSIVGATFLTTPVFSRSIGNSEDISDVTNTITQYLWLAKSDQNKRND